MEPLRSTLDIFQEQVHRIEYELTFKLPRPITIIAFEEFEKRHKQAIHKAQVFCPAISNRTVNRCSISDARLVLGIAMKAYSDRQ